MVKTNKPGRAASGSITCQVCSSKNAELFLDMGDHPPCIFLKEDELKNERTFRLDAYYCRDCGLVQLGHLVDSNILFSDNYHHIAALSKSFQEHLRALAASLAERFKLSGRDLAMDLGSNDGALLEAFQSQGAKILGVDPSDVADMANKKGLTTLRTFFNEETAAKIKNEHGQAKIITSLNTFAHVSGLDSFLRGVKLLLTDDGAFVSESHYLLDLIQDLQYDFIYHEHSRYYSVRHLVFLFERFGMEVFDVERIPTHSGSIRVFAGKIGAHPVSKAVAELLAEEEKAGLSKMETYRSFADKVFQHRGELQKLLKGLQAEGATIAGVTFPARAVTLLNFCGIGPETLRCISEASHLKIGRVSPGTHVKVEDEKIMFQDGAPQYGLILSWHIQKELIPKFRAKGFKGKFIIPLPKPVVLD